MNESDAQREQVEQLIERLRAFIAELEPAQREAFAALLAPGIAAAFEEQETSGFARVGWLPDLLPDYLARVIRERGLRIVIDPPPDQT